MIRIVVLDTGPLGVISNPKLTPETVQCREWLDSLKAGGVEVVIPAIADYEIRRELLRARKLRGLARLNTVTSNSRYLDLTDAALKLAAEYWSRARQHGRPTADDKSWDADVILAAQAALLGLPASDYVVATSNPAHIARFVPAKRWQEITIGDE